MATQREPKRKNPMGIIALLPFYKEQHEPYSTVGYPIPRAF
ncbi:MAG: hypothetical protein WBI82_10220 [Sphaerochaeta sp.]